MVILLTLVAATAHFVFRFPAAQMNGNKEETLTVWVNFEPGTRDVPTTRPFITVHVTPGKDADISDHAVTSPWVRTIQVGTGRVVTLMATQAFGTRIECKIIQGGIKGPALDRDWLAGPGQVICETTA